MCNCIQSSVSGHNVHTHHSISCEHCIADVYGDVLQSPPSVMLLQLKDDLGKKNMLFPKSCIELTRVIGQGMYWGNPLYVLAMLVVITGESGLVYRGYVNRGEMKELVAIKTGKGSYQNLKPCVNGVCSSHHE